MNFWVTRVQRLQNVGVVVLMLVVAGVVGYEVFPRHSGVIATASTAAAASTDVAQPDQSTNASRRGVTSVRLSPVEQKQLGVQTRFVRYNSDPDKSVVRMAATTALDPDTLAHVHPRFAGETIEVKVRLGQHVTKGQTLAVLWSKDLGEKKSELIDARSQMAFNKSQLDMMRDPYNKGAIPEATYRQAVRDYDAARIAYNRAYQTLVSWRLGKGEIDHIEHEKGTDWPRVVVEAPRDGTVVEKNAVAGEMVDPTVNLFVISDLSRLSVWASALEDDLLRLRAGDEWSVTLKALPGQKFQGKIDVIGAVFDPTQHTVTVQGTIANKLSLAELPPEPLRAGMYATATVHVQPDASLVDVPTSALIDDGEHTYVYVESKDPGLFERREVIVQERDADRTLLRRGVLAGEKVVARGAPELEQKAQAEP